MFPYRVQSALSCEKVLNSVFTLGCVFEPFELTKMDGSLHCVIDNRAVFSEQRAVRNRFFSSEQWVIDNRLFFFDSDYRVIGNRLFLSDHRLPNDRKCTVGKGHHFQACTKNDPKTMPNGAKIIPKWPQTDPNRPKNVQSHSILIIKRSLNDPYIAARSSRWVMALQNDLTMPKVKQKLLKSNVDLHKSAWKHSVPILDTSRHPGLLHTFIGWNVGFDRFLFKNKCFVCGKEALSLVHFSWFL